MKVLVLGDMIHDIYRHFTASRLCPEGPVPVLVDEKKWSTPGGAGLVAAQLTELIGDNRNVMLLTGSYSQKERIFADDRLMIRMDSDSEKTVCTPEIYLDAIEVQFAEFKPDAIIVSDYGKGSFTQQLGEWLIRRADDLNIPVFVDAKNNSTWYDGAFAIFPNEKESASLGIWHIIRKLGARGCQVDGIDIPTIKHAVRDVTGAGDVFLAAFVYHWLTQNLKWMPPFPLSENDRLTQAAVFANKVAGISVEYVGTHVVTKKEIDENN